MRLTTPFFLLAASAPLLVSALPKWQTSLGGVGSTLFGEGSWDYDDCGAEGDAVIVSSIVVSPDPPIPGQNLTVTVEGLVVDPITEGAYADVLVKFGLIKVLQRRFDLCELAAENNASVQCPVGPGPLTITETVALPKEIPPGKYNVQIRAFTADDKDLLCENLHANFPIRRGPKEVAGH